MLEKIVVGYAGDQAGRDAVKLAAKLAAVLSSHVTIVFPYHPLFASVPGDRAEEDVRGEVQTPTAGIGGLAAPTYHWSPSPWPIHALHILMLGSRAYGPLRHVLLGSVSACVMREARCPVLVVPRGASPHE